MRNEHCEHCGMSMAAHNQDGMREFADIALGWLVGGLSFGIIMSAWAVRFGYGPNDLVATIGLVGCLVRQEARK